MNVKQYSELMKHLSIENDAKEKDDILRAVRNVQEGKNVSVKDLDVTREYINKQSLSNDKGMDLNYLALDLEEQVVHSKEDVKKSKQRVKRRGLDLERLRRQRRIYQNETHKGKVMELSVEDSRGGEN